MLLGCECVCVCVYDDCCCRRMFLMMAKAKERVNEQVMADAGAGI